jgi:hypothetical protein
MPDFSDPDHFGYSMSQGGNLQHFDKVTGARRSIRPVHPDGDELRFNWNAGLTSDPFQTEKIYLGSQYLHQSTDQGRSWQIISPDLTTDDPVKQRHSESGGLTIDASGAETHTTIISIGPSALEEGLIWVGTDDGNVQITQDGGNSWENVRDSIGGLPHGIWISDVQPSKHQTGRAYLVAEDHRRGDWTPHVYVTEDYGLTWRSLASENIDGFVHAIEEDPENPNLLFLGTEFGLRVSLDRGDSWMRYTSGVPAVPIRDLIVHPRDGDLVLGTHGRSLIVLDDIRPLRELASDSTIQNAMVHVFSPPPAYDVNIAEAIGYRSTGHAMQQAETRPNGALISFWSVEGGQGQVTVTSESMDTVYSQVVSANPGVTRFSWDLRPGGDADLMRFPEQMSVFPGTYSVTVSIGDIWSSSNLEVSGDPRNPRDMEDLVAKREALVMMVEITRSVDEAREELERLMLGVENVLETLDESEGDLRQEGQGLWDALHTLEERLFTGPECQGSCGGDVVADVIAQPIGRITGEDGAPSENTRTMIDQAVAAAETIRSELAAIIDGSVAAYRAALISAGYTPIGGAL